MGIFHTTNVTILAQITVALRSAIPPDKVVTHADLAFRVFAVTKKKRGPISALAILIAAGLIFGYYSVIRIALGPRKFLDRSFDPSRENSQAYSAIVARHRPRRVQGLLLQTMAAWGDSLHQSNDFFRYVLTLQPPELRRASHATLLTSCHRRPSCVLYHRGRDQEIKDE